MKLTRFLAQILVALVLAAAGLAGGWYARSQTETVAPASPPPTAAEDGKKEEDPFTQQAYQNMGVRWRAVEKTDFTVYREVPAVVAELPSSLRPVSARWSGTLVSVLPESGTGEEEALAAAGLLVFPESVLFTILRSPLPLIDRALTGDIVQSVSEAVHEAGTELRAAEQTLSLAKLEWERVRKLNETGKDKLPVIPRQTEINLRYEMLKAKAEVEKIRSRLYLHGLTDPQIESVMAGQALPPAPDLWKRALERNGLWPANGGEIIGLLPQKLRSHPWTYAGMGELNARGQCDAKLVRTLKEVDALGGRFHELVALVQQGYSLEDVVDLHRTGSLDPLITVRVPAGAPEWEVREIRVKPGEKVEAGQVLALLADNRRMMLELEAPGRDITLVDNALEEGASLSAVPLVTGAGPTLSDVSVLAYRKDEGHGPRAFALVENEPVPIMGGEGPPRTAWRLRPGMRYKVRIPVKTHENAFVVPRAAVVKEGPDRVVFIRAENKFRRQPVWVVYENYETVVCADDGSIFDGDEVVLSGAFPLCLALKATGDTLEGRKHKHGPS